MKPSIPILLTIMTLFFCEPPLYAGRTDTVAPARKVQPIGTTLISATPVTLRILNDSGLRGYENIVLDWELRANGLVRQKGRIGNLPIPPGHAAVVRLPIRILSVVDEELLLGLHYRYRDTRSPGHAATYPAASAVVAGRSLGDQWLLLKRWTGSQLSVKPAGELSFTDSNGLFTILSPVARLRFDKQTGWLQSYEVKDHRLVEDSAGLTSLFWLEPADPGYIADSAAVTSSWKEAGRAPHLQLFSTSTGSQLVIVKTEYTLPETSCLLHLSYTINSAGEMQVGQTMEADSTKQGESLPRFGMYWKLPPGFDSVTEYGGSVTPSRENTLYGNNTYTGVRCWTIAGPERTGLRLTADSTLLTIGTRSSTPCIIIDKPASPYHLPYGSYRYIYKISPVLPEEKGIANK